MIADLRLTTIAEAKIKDQKKIKNRKS